MEWLFQTALGLIILYALCYQFYWKPSQQARSLQDATTTLEAALQRAAQARTTVTGEPVVTHPVTSGTNELRIELNGLIVNPWSDWRALVQEDPQHPHLMVIGPTRSGKTYLSRALAADREGLVTIIDPNYQPGGWGDVVPVTTSRGMNYDPIERHFQALLAEMGRRADRYQQGKSDPPLTIIWDEVPETVRNCPSAGPFLRAVAMMAAKYQMRLILITQSDRVGALGIKNFGDARENFLYVYLGTKAIEFARRRYKKVLTQADRIAAVEYRGQCYQVDITMAPTLIQRGIAATRQWRPSRWGW